MNFISDYKKVNKTEWLKLKGSGIFWLTLIMSAFIPVLFTIAKLLQDGSTIVSLTAMNPWKEQINNCFQGFGSFFFPIFLTLVVIRLTQMEHRGGGWKLIETQPVSKSALYLGKFSMSVLISFFCIASLVLFSLLGGVLTMLIKPEYGFSKAIIPVAGIASIGFRLFISGLGILAIQFLFSVVISGFLGPFGIGLAATVAGSILTAFGKAQWWPWAAPAQTINNLNGSATGKFLLHFEWLSIFWMLLALWLGYQWYQRKTFIRAYFKPPIRIAYWFLPILAFVSLFLFINKPGQLPPYGKTVIAGSFETKSKIQKAFLLVEPMYDTVLEINVVNNKFHLQTDKDILPAVYIFKVEGLEADQIFFGTGDSLFINIKSDGKSKKFTNSGNRMPENEFLKTNDGNYSYQLNYLGNYGYELKPNVFARELMLQWRKEIEKIDNFKTVDNLKPADDFIALQKKLVSIRYLKLLDIKYAQKFKVYNPNDTLKFPKTIDEIRNAVTYTDSNLLSYEVYRDIITDYFQQKLKMNVSTDTGYIKKTLAGLPQSPIRDYLLYNRIKEAIGRTRDSVKRENLITNYVPLISKIKTQHKLIAQHELLKSLHRGKPAPDFFAAALNKDTFSIETFNGRYVVIDVWATWCGPCKVQSPNFERLAEQFTSPAVAFVALSIDENSWAWRNEAIEKSSRVLQLIAKDKDSFGKSYGLETIPRFILLGPDGKIINVQMPYPSEPEFEEILKREIPGLSIY